MSLSIKDKGNPKPFTLTTLHITLRNLKDKDGEPYDLSGASKFYCTVKDSLSDLDNAHVQINSSSNPSQFITTYASTGNLDVILTPTNTNLTAGTFYYIDVAAIWVTGVKVILMSDTIVFQTPSTLATS